MSDLAQNGDLKKGRRRKPCADVIHTDRLPPHSEDMERGVLGCILIQPTESINQCMEKLRDGPDEFYDLRHQTIYRNILAMHMADNKIDVLTVYQRLKDCEMLDQVGGISYLNSLQDSVPSAANLGYYLDVVSEKHTMRRLIHVCTDVVGRVYEHVGDVSVLQDEAERDIMGISRRKLATKLAPTLEIVTEAVHTIETLIQSKGRITGLSTGFIDLDKLTNGMHPGDMIVISAFTSVGKTSFAMNIAEHVGVEHRIPTAVFSLEMRSRDLVTRMICSMARINLRNIREGFATDQDLARMVDAAGRISSAPIHFDDTGGLSIYDLRARARRLAQEHGIKLFVVDYLQLLNAIGGPRKVENRQQEVSDISNGLKTMAKELDATVIALSQLNDDGKLRESRAIGMDADSLWEIQAVESEEDTDRYVDFQPCKLWLRKNRNGPRGIHVDLTFLKNFTRFENAAKVDEADIPHDQPSLPV